jgi:hypothetical protein
VVNRDEVWIWERDREVVVSGGSEWKQIEDIGGSEGLEEGAGLATS